MLDFAPDNFEDFNLADLGQCFSRAASVVEVPEPMTASDWADEYFYLSGESSSTSGRWRTTPVQRAILNAMGSDAIEKVDFFKPTRFGGTKMDIAVMLYFIEHKRRTGAFYQPTKDDSDNFVKSEINTAIRDCEVVRNRLVDPDEKSVYNTLSYKMFEGCAVHFKGGHSSGSYERITCDFVILDELDQFNASPGGGGDPTTLSWGRVRGNTFRKQIQTSKPKLEHFSLIEKSAKAADDFMTYQVPCPECGEPFPIDWGGPDTPHGFKWQDRDASTVRHFCIGCGVGWKNEKLAAALEKGFWLGKNGYRTVDAIAWTRDGKTVDAPRHVAFGAWSGYSTFVPWSQLVEEWHDAQGDIEKIQAFTNNTLARVWKLESAGSFTAELVGSIIPTDDLTDIIAITAGVDVQDNRLEVQYMGHDLRGNFTVLGYDIFTGDPGQDDVWITMGSDILSFEMECGHRLLRVQAAAIDTQGHHTPKVHQFLNDNRRGKLFFGINGNGAASYEIADKISDYKGDGIRGGYYNIGTNPLKQKIMSAVRNHDGNQNAFRIWAGANLPRDYATQLAAEKMEVRRINGVEKVVFTNVKGKRNEALDTAVYGLAAKAYLKTHRGYAGRKLFAA